MTRIAMLGSGFIGRHLKATFRAHGVPDPEMDTPAGFPGWVAVNALDSEARSADLNPIIKKGSGYEIYGFPTISAPGVIEPRTKVEISAQVAARVIALPFREGQSVKKGDLVAQLDAVEFEAAVASARAAMKSEEARLEGARATYANAQSEAARQRELFDTKDIPRSTLDQAMATRSCASSDAISRSSKKPVALKCGSSNSVVISFARIAGM